MMNYLKKFTAFSVEENVPGLRNWGKLTEIIVSQYGTEFQFISGKKSSRKMGDKGIK